MNKRKAAALFLLTGVVTLVFFIYRAYQPSITYIKCHLCDGNQYQKMFDYVAGSVSVYNANFPYYSRIIVPALAAAASGQDALWGFQIVNWLFSVLSVFALYYLWYKLEIPFYLICIGLGWLLFHWTGLIRLNAFDPITVDLPTYLIQTLFILIVLNRRYQWLLVLAPVSVLQRESITVLLLALMGYELVLPKFFTKSIEWKHVWIIAVTILLTVGIKYVFTYYYPPLDSGKSSLRLVGFYIKEVLSDPFKLIRWLVGIFMAYGVFLMLAIINTSKRDFKSQDTIFLGGFSIVYLMLGLIAGGDFTRIVFLGFPFIMTWILLKLKKVYASLVFVALGLSVYQMRLFDKIPDPGEDFGEFASWYPEFANHHIVLGWLIFFLICLGIIAILNRLFQKKSDFKD